MSKLKITAAGDALMVKRFPKAYNGLGGVSGYIKKGDFGVVNAETIISDFNCFPSATSGGTWVNARPEVLADIMKFGFSACGASNNHALDYSHNGIRETIKNFKAQNVPFCGIGESLEEASRPVSLECENGSLAVIAICTGVDKNAMAGQTAKDLPSRPGQNVLRHSTVYEVTKEHLSVLRDIAKNTAINGSLENNIKMGFALADENFSFGSLKFREGKTERKITKCNERDVTRTVNSIKEAKKTHDAVVIMLHSHEIRATEYTEPDAFVEDFCRRCIDAGADAIIGGGTHQLKPIEIYKGKPIFYSLGDFVFQNNSVEILPPDFKEQYGVPITATAEEALSARSDGGKRGLHTDISNYLSVIPYFEVEGGEVKNIRMLPIELAFYGDEEIKGLPHVADEKSAKEILRRLREISREYKTEFELENGEIIIK